MSTSRTDAVDAARLGVMDAIGDLAVQEAVALLDTLVNRLRRGLPVDNPPRRLMVVAGCPSEWAYQQHRLTGEPVCDACQQHMARLEGQRRAEHPEWSTGA